MKLDRERIIDGAFALIAAEGLDGLAMRPLAARLGVRASALYWHVPDKQQLYGLMAARLYRAAHERTLGAADARAWLESLGHGLHAALLQVRDSARLCALAPPQDTGADAGTRLAAPLVAMGLPQARALDAIASVLSLTLGWVVYEQSRALHAHLTGMLDPLSAYATGLGALVEGLVDTPAPIAGGLAPIATIP